MAIDPDFAEALGGICRNIAWLCNSGRIGEENLQKAKTAGDHALAVDPENVEAHVGLGYYHYYGYRDYETALKYFERAIILAPGRPDAFRGKASVLRRMGMYELSLAEYEKARDLDPRNWGASVSVAYAALFLRDFEKEVQTGENLVEIWPDIMGSYLVLIDALVNMDGDTLRAAKILDQALEHGSLWEVIEVSDNIGLARSFFATVGASQSHILLTKIGHDWSEIEIAELEYMKSQVLMRNGNLDAARSKFLRIVDMLEPRVIADPDIYFNYPLLAGAYMGLNRHPEAIALCRRGLENDKIAGDSLDSGKIMTELAAALSNAGKEEEAIDLLEELLGRPSVLNLGRLKADPAWDPLRDNPRFQKLVTEKP